jgi:hypothetical protein
MIKDLRFACSTVIAVMHAQGKMRRAVILCRAVLTAKGLIDDN